MVLVRQKSEEEKYWHEAMMREKEATIDELHRHKQDSFDESVQFRKQLSDKEESVRSHVTQYSDASVRLKAAQKQLQEKQDSKRQYQEQAQMMLQKMEE